MRQNSIISRTSDLSHLHLSHRSLTMLILLEKIFKSHSHPKGWVKTDLNDQFFTTFLLWVRLSGLKKHSEVQNMLILTNEDIRQDIRRFEQRIQDARDKLSALPETAGTWQARKKLDEKKRILNDEIRHVNKLIDMAREALEDK